MAYVDRTMGKWMPEDSPRVAVDSRPRLIGIMDTINATRAHGPQTKLPSEFYDEKALGIIEKIGVEEWYAGYGESREYRMLGIGGLMGDLVARMVGSVEASSADGNYELPAKSASKTAPIRFGMSGCHDTTLSAVLSSLGAFSGTWPPFTSHIAIELFREPDLPLPTEKEAPKTVSGATGTTTSSSSSIVSWFGQLFGGSGTGVKAGTPPPGIGRKPTEALSVAEKEKLEGYFVRLRYNDEPVTIPGCRAPGKHLDGDESFCTLVSPCPSTSIQSHLSFRTCYFAPFLICSVPCTCLYQENFNVHIGPGF
jgi:acid phosphatase